MQLFLFLPKHTQFKLFVNVGENSFWVLMGPEGNDVNVVESKTKRFSVCLECYSVA